MLQTTFSSQKGVTVQLSVSVSALIYEVVPLSQTGLQILAQVGSLLGTVLVVMKLIMNWMEKRWRKSRESSTAATSEGAVVHESESDSRQSKPSQQSAHKSSGQVKKAKKKPSIEETSAGVELEQT